MSTTPTTETPSWYASWFESPWYMQLYRHRGNDEARQVVQLIDHTMHIPHGAEILDLCCGFGRHTIALAERGYRVTGLDYSRRLIEYATEYNAHPDATYVVGDIRGPYPLHAYALIANLFTSFGYFEDHSEHCRVFSTIHDHLMPGGRLVMDFFNATVLRKTLVAESMSMIGETTVIQDRWIDEPYVRKRITINVPCQAEHSFEERVWMYRPDEIRAMMQQAGLTIVQEFGSYEGAPFDESHSERVIIVAERPL